MIRKGPPTQIGGPFLLEYPMWQNKFVISLSGNGECGKDTAAPFFSHFLRLPYQKSTSSCVVEPWWEEIQQGRWEPDFNEKPYGLKHINIPRTQYASKQEFYEGRRDRRMDWVDYIEAFNWNYGGLGVGLYAKTVEQGNQILTGIRRVGQFQRCLKHIIDVSIWINRPGCTNDESQEYGPELCDHVLENDGTIEELKNKCANLSKDILISMSNDSYVIEWIELCIDELNQTLSM